MRNYEIMFIVNPNSPDDEVDKINSQIEGMITAGGGKVEKIEKMGKRKLAYEIDRNREGHYVLFVVQRTATSFANANAGCGSRMP